jgi:hypothetical protein
MVTFEQFKSIAVKLIDSSVVDIKWASNHISHEQPVIIFALSSQGRLYRSGDSGLTWDQQNEKFGYDNILSMHVSKVDPSHAFFIGAKGKNFFTTDSGVTFGEYHHPLNDVRMHPTQAAWLLGSNESPGCKNKDAINPEAEPEILSNGEPDENVNCFMRLFYSKNMGQEWTQIATHIVQYDWAMPEGEADKETGLRSSDDLILVAGYIEKNRPMKVHTWDSNIHLLGSKDYFQTWKTLVPHGNRFFMGPHGHVFAAQVDVNDESKINLMVFHNSTGMGEFVPAHVPSTLSHHSYTILDSSEQAVFLHINHRPLGEASHTGHLYVSDATGEHFSLSLPNIERSPEGFCAFAKVEGLEGVYLANYVSRVNNELINDANSMGPVAEGEGGRQAKSPLTVTSHTSISFDRGGEWYLLAAPEKDSNGESIPCGQTSDLSQKCHLHLHGLARDKYGPFYSDRNAIGLIMATGSVGQNVQEHAAGVNTYISRDAGYTWYEAFKGSHIYEFGDHGGLMVMAQDIVPTDLLYYSWDEGATWEAVKIVSSPFVVENIVIEPSNTDVRFLIYGYHPDSGAGIIVHIDFMDLHERTCVGENAVGAAESDYELWTPHDERMEGKCLLGHETQYLRRKQLSKCFNPIARMPVRTYADCPCKRSDYLCDYGYMKQNPFEADSPCVLDTVDEQSDITKNLDQSTIKNTNENNQCTDNYYVTKGYRKVPGNTCKGGTEWDPILHPCGGHTKWTVMLFVILIVVAMSLGMVALSTKYDLGEIVINFYDKLSSRASGKYSLIGKKSNEMDVDDLDLNDDDEFAFTHDSEAGSGFKNSESGSDLTLKDDDFGDSSDVNMSTLSGRKHNASGGPASPAKINYNIPKLAPAPTDSGVTIVNTNILNIK